jgi:hypothetical protein
MDKQLQEALARIDQVVSGINMSRQAHVQLVQDVNLVQTQLTKGLEAQKELEFISKEKKEQ